MTNQHQLSTSLATMTLFVYCVLLQHPLREVDGFTALHHHHHHISSSTTTTTTRRRVLPTKTTTHLRNPRHHHQSDDNNVLLRLQYSQFPTTNSFNDGRQHQLSSSSLFNEQQQQQRQKQRHRQSSFHNRNNYNYNNNNTKRRQRRRNIPDDEKMKRAISVEQRLDAALQSTRRQLTLLSFPKTNKKTPRTTQQPPSSSPLSGERLLPYPPIRDCNAALATIGDAGDLTRALRLFIKMRRSAPLHVAVTRRLNEDDDDDDPHNHHNNKRRSRPRRAIIPPAPNMVTYSTLMSRAMNLGKPRVALRLWMLMRMQKEFFRNCLSDDNNDDDDNDNCDLDATTTTISTPSSPTTTTTTTTTTTMVIIPDVKAANILMNVYAKLGDYESARDLMEQMRCEEGGEDVPMITPNIVTYNTLLDACRRAGQLPLALSTLSTLLSSPHNIKPDTRTYTSLISTVARRSTPDYGGRDPDMAFVLLDDMISKQHLEPNAMTYCALIDVCSRCGRSDLALKGLRMMLRRKRQRRRYGYDLDRYDEGEVGAWTAAIDACGKAGHTDTAIRLFHSMEDKFGTSPNAITCGCLTDVLLKDGRVREALEVLRFMKERGMEPSEVMYTSLISSAGRLVKLENKLGIGKMEEGEGEVYSSRSKGGAATDGDTARAIDLYKELMGSLMLGHRHHQQQTPANSNNENNNNNNNNILLLKVFLVYQEMKAVGAIPDLACYNALLNACARAGDLKKACETFHQLLEEGYVPNEITWKELLRAASAGGDVTFLKRLWNEAYYYHRQNDSGMTPTTMEITSSFQAAQHTTTATLPISGGGSNAVERRRWIPNAESFEILVGAYSRHADVMAGEGRETECYSTFLKIVKAYEEVLLGSSREDEEDDDERGGGQQQQEGEHPEGLGYIDVRDVQRNQKLMLIILRAAVVLELVKYDPRVEETEDENEATITDVISYRTMAEDIVRLECLMKESLSTSLKNDAKTMKALQLARIWSRTTTDS